MKTSNGLKIKSIRQAKDLKGKAVFLRLDLNVPIINGRIKDDYKIVMSLPTIRFLLRHDCRLIIGTHLAKARTAKPIANRLTELLDKKVQFVSGAISPKHKEVVNKMKAKEVTLLENLRFNRGEEENSNKFARNLATLAEIYVNDAFAVCHRNHASVSALKKYLPSFAGLLLEKEITNLEKILKPKQPLVSIFGGAKIETKISLLNNLAKRSYRVLIGGALANNFIAAHGFKIGRSLSDKASIKIASGLIKRHKNIILPVDVVTAKGVNLKKLLRSGQIDTGRINNSVQAKPVSQVLKDEMILDIGPRTVRLFANFIRQANTLIWNGPLGYFESDHFKHGTLSVARLVAARSTGQAYGAVGGGETIEALKMTKMEHYIDWVSTGGGAMLAFLSGEKMPGLKKLVK